MDTTALPFWNHLATCQFPAQLCFTHPGRISSFLILQISLDLVLKVVTIRLSPVPSPRMLWQHSTLNLPQCLLISPWLTFTVQQHLLSSYHPRRWSAALTRAVSSTTAELYALREALRHLFQRSPPLWLVIPDSRFALLSLHSCTSASADLSRDIVLLCTMLSSKGTVVRLQWILHTTV